MVKFAAANDQSSLFLSLFLFFMKVHLRFVSACLFLFFINSLFSQTIDISRTLWSAIGESDIIVDPADRQIIPNSYLVLRLDVETVRQQLLGAPEEMEVINHVATPLIMEFPNPAGGFSKYKVWYFSPMHPDLQAQYPEIRSYAGIGIDDPSSHVFFDVTPKGFHSMTLRSKGGSVFIDPYSKNDTEHYLVYFKRDFVKKEADRMVCEVGDPLEAEIKDLPEELLTTNCGKRREYRLALACTGEYAAFHGGTTALALAAMNTSMTRVNGVYVTEVSVKMNIIANNSLIIYLNGATDPYTNNNGGTMLTENQNNLTTVIGAANYDVGHVFSTGGGGVAVLQSPCSAASKAKGVTGGPSPVGDPFDIDYVAHEMGHQYGGAHTFSSTVGSCSGNGSASSAYEPGSGTTIMAYAGICGAANVQSNSDAYFHAQSLAQIGAFVTGAGHTCDTEITISNGKPTVAALTGISCPKSTPFVLNGSATDPNGDPVNYCWEQFNAALVSPPAASNISGPLFRSLNAVAESYRYFPSFDNIFGNTTDPWEILPGVARTLTFRLTARDNVITGGCTDEKDINVLIDGNAGPFIVTAPNGGETLEATSSSTVTWNVAGTDANSTNCANVDILYSTTPADPTSYVMLLASTPNDGTQAITVPNIVSSTVRIMVRCASTNGTFFFDISNANFSIIPTTTNYCYTFASTDVPKTIPLTASATPITSNIVIGGSTTGTITDVNVTDLNILHTFDRELVVSLKSPANTIRSLFAGLCLDNDNVNLKFDDNASNTYGAIPCPPTTGLTYQSNETMAAFNGQAPVGTWQLQIVDNVAGNGGSLQSWSVEICLNQQLLPVELVSFSAVKQQNTVALNWETATERNNRGFYVERSTGSDFDFQRVGFVPAVAKIQSKNHYRFTDPTVVPGNIYYYRLRQEDIDGHFVYSDVKSVAFEGVAGLLQIAPNPARTAITLTIDAGEKEATYTINVFSNDGRLVLSRLMPITELIDISAWPDGVYTVQALTERKVWIGKVVKI